MQRIRSRLLPTLVSGALLALGSGPVLAHTAPQAVGIDSDQAIQVMGDGQSVLPADEGKSLLIQDSSWLRLKASHRLVAQPSTGAPIVTASAPAALSAWSIDNPSVRAVLEPGASGTDDADHAFSDQDYWHFCSAGASDIALYFWNGKTTTFATRTYNEPYGPEHGLSSATTTWTSSDHGRSYLMFLAEVVKPPSFSTPGMVGFSTYPSGGTATQDMRDSINWEASGENPSDWAQYFYAWVKNDGTITPTGLHSDIVGDIFGASGDGVPLIA